MKTKHRLSFAALLGVIVALALFALWGRRPTTPPKASARKAPPTSPSAEPPRPSSPSAASLPPNPAAAHTPTKEKRWGGYPMSSLRGGTPDELIAAILGADRERRIWAVGILGHVDLDPSIVDRLLDRYGSADSEIKLAILMAIGRSRVRKIDDLLRSEIKSGRDDELARGAAGLFVLRLRERVNASEGLPESERLYSTDEVADAKWLIRSTADRELLLALTKELLACDALREDFSADLRQIAASDPLPGRRAAALYLVPVKGPRDADLLQAALRAEAPEVRLAGAERILTSISSHRDVGALAKAIDLQRRDPSESVRDALLPAVVPALRRMIEDLKAIPTGREQIRQTLDDVDAAWKQLRPSLDGSRREDLDAQIGALGFVRAAFLGKDE